MSPKRLSLLGSLCASLGLVACLGPNSIIDHGGAGGGGSATSSSSSSSSSSGTSGGETCAQVNDGVGCCDATGVLHYCDSASTAPKTQSCGSGTVCGWNAEKIYYDCVPFPGGADPKGKYPLSCADVGSSSSSSSSGGASSSSSSGGASPTWTQIYDGIFGPVGSSSCGSGGSCHVQPLAGFKCGADKGTCYDGMVASGLVAPGPNAGTSRLVAPGSSPLCSLGGNMPKYGTCVTPAQVATIQAWLAAGAPND